MKKQLFAIVLILSYRLNGAGTKVDHKQTNTSSNTEHTTDHTKDKKSTKIASSTTPFHTSSTTPIIIEPSNPPWSPFFTTTSSATPITIESINTPGSPICTTVYTPQLSVTDTSGDNYTCDFKTLASTSFSNFKFISNGDGFGESPGKITIQENPTGKIIILNNCIFNFPLDE